MKKISAFLVMLSITGILFAQYTPVIFDDFTRGVRYKDNALVITPDGYDAPARAFKIEERKDDNNITFSSITFTDTAVYESGSTFKFFANFDYIFPDIIFRDDEDTLIVEFDLIFDVISGSGEANRTYITLLKELPEEGLTDPADPENWGLPTYSTLIFSGNYSCALAVNNEYGTENPSWIHSLDDRNYNWPEPADYGPHTWPEIGYSKRMDGLIVASSTDWIHFTMVVAYEVMDLYYRLSSEPPEANVHLVTMAIPSASDPFDQLDFINEHHGILASEIVPEYMFHEEYNALRIFNRGARENFNMSNIKVTHTGDPLNTQFTFNRNKAVVGKGSGSYELDLDIFYPDRYEPASCDVELISGDPALADNFETLTFNFEPGNEVTETIPIPITDDGEPENDTLVFAIRNMQGGFFPMAVQDSVFTLVLTGSSNIADLNTLDFSIHPNPATNFISVDFDRNAADMIEFEIFNLAGKRLAHKLVDSGTRLDISNLREGTYICRYKSGNLVGQQKIVIIR